MASSANVRPSANFAPSLWGDLFTSSSINDHNHNHELYGEEIKALKEEVARMLVATEATMAEKLKLIDTVERLGVSYHFEKEIGEQVLFLYNNAYPGNEDGDDDLQTVALYFRLLRQHGCSISSGIFEKFRSQVDGRFDDGVKDDVEGMLSLYEAAHLRTHGEQILDEALAFATAHLESIAPLLSSPMKEQVEHALEQCLHRGLPRVEARRYVLVYQELESKNESLLRLAKLDFNMVQVLHRQELRELMRWWKEMDLVSKLAYARDRMVECYFWALGVYFEPQYSRARVMLAKTIAMISVVDDTYDSYGTLDELQLFTDVVQRWEMKEINKLPEYMKICFRALLELYDEYEEELRPQGRSFAVDYAKATMQEIVRSYNIEAKWFIEGYMPPFLDYMTNGFVTGTYYLLGATSFIGMSSATKEAFDWLINKPTIQVANVIIGRVIDDVATYEIEKNRGQSATGIECYMKDHGVSKEEAMEEFKKMAEDAWKDMNGEIFMEKSVSMEVMKRIVNLSRLIDVAYKNNQDGYTHPEKVLKPLVQALLVDSLY